MARRVAITGLGTVSALGLGMSGLWEGLCAGRSGLRPLTRLDASGFPSRLGGEVQGFSAKDFVPKHYRKAVKVMARDIELAVAAAKFAVEDAKLITRGTQDASADEAAIATTYPGARMGCHIGAGLIAAEAEELAAALVTARDATDPGELDLKAWGRTGMESLTPLWLLKYLPNMLACHVTIIHGCCGPSNTITCAEASGLLSIAESVRVIERGQADLCFSGGAESKVNLMGVLRLDFAGRLAPTGDHTQGEHLVRPFDPASPGGLVGEGAGILVLEAMETARARGARVYAEIVGVGGGHSPAPRSGTTAGLSAGSGPIDADEGLIAAIENALQDAALGPDAIDAVVVAGQGVPIIDLAEAGALRQVFGKRLSEIPLATLAPGIGNCMAGMGGILAAVGAQAMFDQRLPARLNAGTPTPDLRAEAAPARDVKMGNLLVCSSALGGQSAAIVLARA
jgi:3-oxoacyl-[acyl-carrier-protein] synthase II